MQRKLLKEVVFAATYVFLSCGVLFYRRGCEFGTCTSKSDKRTELAKMWTLPGSRA
jgi:hypothetical protein